MVVGKYNILSNGASYAWQKSKQILYYIKQNLISLCLKLQVGGGKHSSMKGT